MGAGGKTYSTRIAKRVARWLEKEGFTIVSGAQHDKIYRRDGSFVHTMPYTGLNARDWLNWRSQIKARCGIDIPKELVR
jgi:hypothetical protein